MVYQILSQQRTGTAFLKSYIGGTFHEFFIGEEGPLPMSIRNIPRDAGYKFDWLEKEKKLGRHHPLTVTDIRSRIFYYLIFVERLIHYYKGYHILTINRNPWDIFMSWYFQQQTGWKFPHQFSEEPFPLKGYDGPQSVRRQLVTDNFKIIITKEGIDGFINAHKENVKLQDQVLKTVTKYTVIEYTDLNKTYLDNFFKKNFKSQWAPMNIDYAKYIVEFNYWKKYFYNEIV